MSQRLAHIACSLLTLLMLGSLPVACNKEARIIPQDEFGALYADMLLADEWIALHPATRRSTDTLLVYGDIFERHGVTVEDVRASLDYYLEDPLRYSRAMEVTINRLTKRSREIKDEIDIRYGIRDFVADFQKGAVMDTLWHFTLEEGFFRVDTLAPVRVYNYKEEVL